MGKICSRIRMYSPATMAKKAPEKEIVPREQRSAPVLRHEFLSHHYRDYAFRVSPEFWNTLVYHVSSLFPTLLKWGEAFQNDMTGAELEHHLFATLRNLMLEQGRQLAEEMQPLVDRGYIGTALTCPQCGGEVRFHSYKEAEFLTPLGSMKFTRAYYCCRSRECSYTVFPLDVKLGTTEHRILPWVAEKVTRYCSELPFEPAGEMIADVLGIPQALAVRTAEELCWDTARVVKDEQDREVYDAFRNPLGSKMPAIEGEVPECLILSTDGTCVPIGEKKDYREARLGAVSHLLTRSSSSGQGEGKEPLLGNHSYVTHIGENHEFFEHFAVECARRGVYTTKRVVMMGDGSAWIWNRFHDHFAHLEPSIECVEILDFWHALDHVGSLGNLIFGTDTTESTRWYNARKQELWESHLEAFFASLSREAHHAAQVGARDLQENILQEIRYFQSHRHRMDYAAYRSQGLPIGSGVIEGGCKHVIKDRVSRSGMRWSLGGCDSILRIRALIKSRRWEDFWKRQRGKHQEMFESLQARKVKKRAA